MSRNGSGVFSLAQPAFVNGTTIDATAMNSDLSDIATALTTSLASDGQTTPSANIKFGGFKATGLGVATTSGDALSYGQAATVSTLAATDVTTTGNTILGDATTDTFNVGNGGITKDASGNVGLGAVPAFSLALEVARASAVMSLNSTTGTNNTQVQFRRANSVYGVIGAVGANDGIVTGAVAGDLVYRNGNGGTGKHLWSVDDGVSIGMSLSQAKLLTVGGGINTSTADNTGLGIAISRSKTATTSRTSTTVLADDPHLIVPLSAGTWSVQLWAPVWGTTSGNAGFQASMAFSGTSTSTAFGTVTNNGFTGFATRTTASALQTIITTTISSSPGGAADWYTVTGTITVIVAGNLSFQWAQLSSTVNAANVGLGGWMNCTKVG